MKVFVFIGVPTGNCQVRPVLIAPMENFGFDNVGKKSVENGGKRNFCRFKRRCGDGIVKLCMNWSAMQGFGRYLSGERCFRELCLIHWC